MKRKRLFRREPHVCKQRSRGHWWNGAAELILHLLFYFKFLQEYFWFRVFISFRCIAKWISYTYTYIHSFLDYFPYRPLQSVEQSSLCYTIGPYQLCVLYIMELPRQLSGKESTRQCRRCGFNPWVGKIPLKRKWQPTPVFLPGKSHGQRSLVSYSPWGH